MKTSASPSLIIFDTLYNYVYKIWISREFRKKMFRAIEPHASFLDFDSFGKHSQGLDYESKMYANIKKQIIKEQKLETPFLYFVESQDNLPLHTFCKQNLRLNKKEQFNIFYKWFNNYIFSLQKDHFVPDSPVLFNREDMKKIKINFTKTVLEPNVTQLYTYTEKLLKYSKDDSKTLIILVYYFIQLLYGLHNLYVKKIVHNDLHFGNVLITNNLKILLYDWDRSYSSTLGNNPLIDEKENYCIYVGICNIFHEEIPVDFCWSFINSFLYEIYVQGERKDLILPFIKLAFPLIGLQFSDEDILQFIDKFTKVPKHFKFTSQENLISKGKHSEEFRKNIGRFFGNTSSEIYSKTLVSERYLDFLKNLKGYNIIDEQTYNSYIKNSEDFKNLARSFYNSQRNNYFKIFLNDMKIVATVKENIWKRLNETEKIYTKMIDCKDINKDEFFKNDKRYDRTKNKLLHLSYVCKQKKEFYNDILYKIFFIDDNKFAFELKRDIPEYYISRFINLFNLIVSDDILKRLVQLNDILSHDSNAKNKLLELFNNEVIVDLLIKLLNSYAKNLLEFKDMDILFFCINAVVNRKINTLKIYDSIQQPQDIIDFANDIFFKK